MIDLKQMDKLFKRQPGNTLLGLAFDGSRLEGVLVRRTNGSVEIKNRFSTALSLDPLTAEVDLAGRELRNQLDAQGIRERWCAVALPLNWALTLTVKLTEIPEEDVESFLQLEAERHFPYSPEELMVASSRFRVGEGELYGTLVGVPREHVVRLEAVLQAAQLKPVTFSFGLAALQPADAPESEGVVTLLPGERGVGMQMTCGGGTAVLRMLEGVFDQVGPDRELQVEQIARELRITVGQLPAGVREAIKTLRILGSGDAADTLAAELRRPAESLGLKVEHVREHPAQMFSIKLPSHTAISEALGVALRRLAGEAGMEFLPPKISQWKQFAERYSSGKLAYAGIGAGAAAAVVLIAFLVHASIQWHWQSKWAKMEAKVTELIQIRDQIRRYRPWYDESVRSLSILKRMTEAFPQDGTVSAKTVELRQPNIVTCSGTALTRDAFIKMLDELQKKQEIAAVHIDTTRGSGPMEFTFNFQWMGPGGL